ncbi:General transcription factor 2-related zinc finger protein [Striga hermonthica]|uniref:General transcription factor 2-related zinc finger protein n=1 Tax=Striga hermonthica TaxID=68872 RepID=A0A9N7RCU7_STRHE|nr:General transcription factor 2-related zinc finger protein [Striga hermonthica]
MEDATDFQSRGVAKGLADKSTSFEFVFIAHLMVTILASTSALSAALQEKTQNIGNALVLIKSVKKDLRKLREDGWEDLLMEVTTFCSEKGIYVPNMEDPMPGWPSRSQREVDDQPKTYLHYFRREIFFQVIDRILQEIDSRFEELSSELIQCIVCLDPRDCFASFDVERLLRLAQLYPNDFDDELKLKAELDQFHDVVTTSERIFFSGLQSIGDLAKRMVERNWHTTLKLVYRLIELALILPVATATVERALSSMKIIKTDLRNKMRDEFLIDSLVCYIEMELFEKLMMKLFYKGFKRWRPEEYSYRLSNHSHSSPSVGS